MAVVLQEVDPHLEREYDVRKLRTDFDAIGRDWASRSHDLVSRCGAEIDVAYGDQPRQRLDLLRSGADRAPLLVFIHGGYWQRGDKAMYGFVAEPFLENGCDVCVVNYTLCPANTLPGIADEIMQALAWLWLSADEIGIERDSIHLCGHSAGGHLTALMQTALWSDYDAALPDCILRSAMPMSGLFDLRPLRFTTISHTLHLDEATAAAQSPILLKPAADIGTLVILGGGETVAFHHQSESFLDAWRPLLTGIDLYGEPEVDHFDLLNRMADSRSALFQRMINHIAGG